MSHVMRKPTMWFPNRFDTNQAAHSQKMAGGWKFWIYVTSTPGHVLTTSLLRPKKIKDVVRTWYGLVGRGRNVVRT